MHSSSTHANAPTQIDDAAMAEVALVYATHANAARHSWFKRLEAYSQQHDDVLSPCSFEVFQFRRSLWLHHSICMIGAFFFLMGAIMNIVGANDKEFTHRCFMKMSLLLLLMFMRQRAQGFKDLHYAQRSTMIGMFIILCIESLTDAGVLLFTSSDLCACVRPEISRRRANRSRIWAALVAGSH